MEEKLNDGLIDATKEDNVQKVTELIKSGALVNKIDSFGNTALHYAARNGSLNMVKCLLKAGINIDTKNLDEKTALDIAHNDDVIDFLRGIKEPNNDLIDAVTKGNYKKALEFIKNGANVNATDYLGNTPMHLAAKNGFLNIITLLRSRGAYDNTENNLGETPFTLAISAGQINILNYFVREGIVCIPECNITTLVENMKQTNSDNRKVQTDIVKCIFSKKTDFPDKEHPGNIFLHYAAKNCQPNIVKRLIETLNAYPNFQDDLGNTILHYAAESDNLKLVEYLVGEKHLSLDIKNNIGKTPVETAVAKGSIKTLNYLVNEIKVVDVPTRVIPSFTSDNGNICNVNAVKLIIAKTVHRLSRYTFLPHAAKHCHLNIVKYLIEEQNVDPNFQDELGNTALHYAAARNRLPLVQYLVDEKHVSLDIQNKIGNTPIHVAAKDNRLDIVKYLLKEEANLSIKIIITKRL
ncbi:ankyrin repeat domain-containing protein [Wolbachia endosymbiont of Chironomus riparius]|uniref:ankyrin repeat domain-containing protein n=1 Tax=Wolbachia endosymbiont of Chironomus riparius TaxID=2883238 RepID=UPI003516D4A4